MRKTKVVRAFKPEFLRHCDAFGWPGKEDMIRWCAKHNHIFVKSGTYSRITAGEASDERHVLLILGFFLDPERAKSRERRSLDQYLRERDVPDTSGLTPEELLDVVSYVDEEPDGGFGLGLHLFVRICALKKTISKHAQLIAKESDVRSGVHWIYAEAGKQIKGRGISDVEASRIGQQHIAMADFEDWVVAMWRAQPWSVIHTHAGEGGANGITGVSMTLSVTPAFYARCRAGECRPEQCTKEDLLPVSHHQIVIALAERPDKKVSAGLSLAAAIVCQQARLSDVPGIFDSDPLHVLSFASTPVGARRLRTFGYKKLGTHFPKIASIFYMERILDYLEGQRLDWLAIGPWRGIQKHLRKVYGPGDRSAPALAAVPALTL
jgi:hypothetical protein